MLVSILLKEEWDTERDKVDGFEWGYIWPHDFGNWKSLAHMELKSKNH